MRISYLPIALALALTVSCSSGGSPKPPDTFLFGEVEELAKSGSPEAQYHLGMFYNNGIGTQKDTAQAFKWFEKSAMAGDPLGSYKLGCYYAGQFQGVVASDKEKALEYKLVAAQQGYALAQYDVAGAYYGNGEIEEAVKWLKKSADQGYSDALYQLFVLYSKGEKIPKDAVLAYGYLKIFEINAGEEEREEIAEKINELKNELSKAQLEQAQEFATNWSAHKTPLTVKAESGLERSERIVEEAKAE